MATSPGACGPLALTYLLVLSLQKNPKPSFPPKSPISCLLYKHRLTVYIWGINPVTSYHAQNNPTGRYCCSCLWIRKLKLREVKCPLQGHRVVINKDNQDRPSDSSWVPLHHDSQAITVSSAVSHGPSLGCLSIHIRALLSKPTWPS